MKLLYSPWLDEDAQDAMIQAVQLGRNALRKKIADAMERNRAVKLLDSYSDPKNWTVIMNLRTDKPVNESFKEQFKTSPGYNTNLIDEVEAKYPGCFGGSIKVITEAFEHQALKDSIRFHRLLSQFLLKAPEEFTLANLEPDEV